MCRVVTVSTSRDTDLLSVSSTLMANFPAVSDVAETAMMEQDNEE